MCLHAVVPLKGGGGGGKWNSVHSIFHQHSSTKNHHLETSEEKCRKIFRLPPQSSQVHISPAARGYLLKSPPRKFSASPGLKQILILMADPLLGAKQSLSQVNTRLGECATTYLVEQLQAFVLSSTWLNSAELACQGVTDTLQYNKEIKIVLAGVWMMYKHMSSSSPPCVHAKT